MSRRAIKAINWAAIAERIPETEKPAFAAFKMKSDQYLRRMTAHPDSKAKIDWDYYKRTIATPGLVDTFKKEYESLQVPYPADKYTSQIDAVEKDTVVKMEAYVKEVNEAIEKYKKEIDRIKNLMPFDQMTMEDFQELYPELAWNPEKPTLWPHIPEVQPVPVPKDPGGH